jgi:hypothetical protein
MKVKRWALSLMMVLASGVMIQAFAQGMAASPSPANVPLGKITAASVWQPPQDFLSKAHQACDTAMSAVSFPECFMNQISVAGAPAEAVAFTRALYGQGDGQVGIMNAFKNFGPVDVAQVFYPLRANDNYGLLLVNGDPKILDVDDLKKLDRTAMDQDTWYQALKKKYPQVDIWPGDRSAGIPWPRVQQMPDGGIEFIVPYPLINGCHACEHVGAARFGWEFDASGKFLKTVFVPSALPPRRRPAAAPPDAAPPQQ